MNASQPTAPETGDVQNAGREPLSPNLESYAVALYPRMKKWNVAKCAQMADVFAEWGEILRAHVAAMGAPGDETHWN